jgi:hypothetical protein
MYFLCRPHAVQEWVELIILAFLFCTPFIPVYWYTFRNKTLTLTTFLNKPSSLLCATFLIEANGLTPKAANSNLVNKF